MFKYPSIDSILYFCIASPGNVLTVILLCIHSFNFVKYEIVTSQTEYDISNLQNDINIDNDDHCIFLVLYHSHNCKIYLYRIMDSLNLLLSNGKMFNVFNIYCAVTKGICGILIMLLILLCYGCGQYLL